MIDRARLVLVEDHPLVLEGLKLELEHDHEVVGLVSCGAEVLPACQKLRPDVVVLDLGLPDRSGLEVISDLKAADVKARILVVTMHNDPVLADAALQAGADGFLPKDAGVPELKHAINEVLHGRQYVSPLVDKHGSPCSSMNLGFDLNRLTPRQQQIVRLLGDGKSTSRIAQELHVSPNTVTFHRVRIRKALGICTEWGLMRYAMVVRLSESQSGNHDPAHL